MIAGFVIYYQVSEYPLIEPVIAIILVTNAHALGAP